MTDSNEGTRFARLNDANFPEWSMRMQAVLIRRSLWNGIIHVVLSASESADKSDDDIVALLQAKLVARSPDKLADARAELILRVEDSQLSYMHDEDPREIWQALERVHRARGFATTLALKRAFLTGKMQLGQSMQSWIGQVSAHVFRMEQAGIAVTELDRILAITMGLPSSYTPVIIHFDSLPAAELTINGVITRLLNEETRQRSDVARQPEPTVIPQPDENGDVAMAAVGSRGKGSASSAAHVTCFLCQEHGHYMATCPLRAAFAAFIKKTMAPGLAAAVEEDGIGEAYSVISDDD